MNASNPFQVPSCLQRADTQLRRRKRIKKIVIGSVAFFVVLLVVLLIEGCVTEHAKVSVGTGAAPADPPQSPPVETAPAVTKPVDPLQPTSAVRTAIAAVVPSAATTAARPAAGAVFVPYVVKPGDTLSHIAKVHRLTVRAIQAANELDTDRIAAGMTLKLPEA